MIYKDFDSFNSVLDDLMTDLELILSIKKKIDTGNVEMNSDSEESRKQLMERLSDDEKSIGTKRRCRAQHRQHHHVCGCTDGAETCRQSALPSVAR